MSKRTLRLLVLSLISVALVTVLLSLLPLRRMWSDLYSFQMRTWEWTLDPQCRNKNKVPPDELRPESAALQKPVGD